MIELNSMAILSMFTMVFVVVTPIWGIWDALLKRQPYISEVRKGVEY